MSGKNVECQQAKNSNEFESETELESQSKEEFETQVECESTKEFESKVEFEFESETEAELDSQSKEEFETQFESTTKFESVYFKELETEIGQESDIDDVIEKVADAIINFFKVKRPKRFIDTDNDNDDLISYEESQFRLILLSFSLSSILSIISLILLIHYCLLTSWSESAIYMYNTENKMTLTWKPKIAIIDSEDKGLLVMYKVTKNFTLIQDWILKLPSPKSPNPFLIEYRNYYGFTDQNQLYIPYGDEHRNMIVIDSNKTHRIVPKSKLNHGYVRDTSSFRVGNYFWIFGGQDLSDPDNACAFRYIQRTVLWSIKKNRWLVGPKLPQLITDGCGLALNRTHAQLFVSSLDNVTCVQSWIFNFKTWVWSLENDCIYQLSTKDEWLEWWKLSCVQLIDKSFHRNIYLMIRSLDGFLNHLLLFQENRSVTKIEHFENYFGLTHHLTLFTMQGKMLMMKFEGNYLGIFCYYPTNNTWKLEQVIESFPLNSTHESKYLVLPLQ